MSASSSSTSVEPCVMCDRPGTLLCGGCRRARFCSARCQRIFWPVHKVSCRRGGVDLYLPPLTPDEIAELERRKDVRLQNGNTLAQGLTATYSTIAWEDFIAIVSSTDTNSDVIRNELIMFAHFHFVLAFGDPLPEQTLSVWQDFSELAFKMTFLCHEDNSNGPPPHWIFFEGSRRLDGVLRRQLATCAIRRAARDAHFFTEAAEIERLVASCVRRTVDEIERADLPQETKRKLVPMVQTRIMQS